MLLCIGQAGRSVVKLNDDSIKLQSLFLQWEAPIALHGQITGQQLQLMAVRQHSLSIQF